MNVCKSLGMLAIALLVSITVGLIVGIGLYNYYYNPIF